MDPDKAKKSNVLHLYVPDEYKPVLDKAKELMEREGKSLSKLFIDAITEYVRLHYSGNPQVPLDRILQLQLPAKPYNQCCVPNCKGKIRYRLLLKDFSGKIESFKVCFKHKEWKHNRFKFLIGLKELRT